MIYAADYYPFGLPIDGNGTEEAGGTALKHLFGGKELQDVMGLQWYEFGARMLDPSLGRWLVLDREAEKHPGVSPYCYALNNPVRYVDPTGLSPWDWIDSGVPPVSEVLVNRKEGAVGEDPMTIEDPMTADEILGNYERNLAQYKSELIGAEIRAQEEAESRQMTWMLGGGLLLVMGAFAAPGLLAAVGARVVGTGAGTATAAAAAGATGTATIAPIARQISPYVGRSAQAINRLTGGARKGLTYKQGFNAGEQAAKAGKELVLGKFPANVDYVARTPGTTTLDVASGWTPTYNAGYIRGFMEVGGKIRQVTPELSGTYEMEVRQILTIPGAP